MFLLPLPAFCRCACEYFGIFFKLFPPLRIQNLKEEQHAQNLRFLWRRAPLVLTCRHRHLCPTAVSQASLTVQTHFCFLGALWFDRLIEWDAGMHHPWALFTVTNLSVAAPTVAISDCSTPGTSESYIWQHFWMDVWKHAVWSFFLSPLFWMRWHALTCCICAIRRQWKYILPERP